MKRCVFRGTDPMETIERHKRTVPLKPKPKQKAPLNPGARKTLERTLLDRFFKSVHALISYFD